MKKIIFLFFTLYTLHFTLLYADIVYLTDNTTLKGLIVEEQYDRFILSVEEGEKGLLKSSIDEIFFDEPYQNNLYLGKKFERAGDFESALKFYRLALQASPDFQEALDAVKGLEDTKWRFKKSWQYSELRPILKAQLGIALKDAKGVITVESLDKGTEAPEGLLKSDVLVSSWEEPLTHAGLKNASRLLIGLSNTMIKVTIERDIQVGHMSGLSIKPFAPLSVSMEPIGPVVKAIKKDSIPYKAGLREGDIIAKIDGENTRYMKLADITKRIFSARQKRVTVKRGIMLMRKRAEINLIKRAMWVWHSKEPLQDAGERQELLDFCAAKNVGTLFLQLQYELSPAEGQRTCKILYEGELRSFLRDAHAAGISVHSLDGSAEFCLENGHQVVLSQLKAIIDFNKNNPAQERFDGVHYDNEPYLLPDFESPKKNEIIGQFIALNEKCKALIRESGVKLEFGVDVPFWFDSLDRLDEKIINICDYIGIMDYRNFASGPDGMIQHAMDEIKYADTAGKKVFIGVETSKYPAQQVYFTAALKQEDAQRLSGLNEFEGSRVRTYTYNNTLYAGLVKPAGADETGFNDALLRFAGSMGGILKPENKEEADNLIFDLTAAVSKNPEYGDAQVREYAASDGKTFLLVKADEVMLAKLTFADMTQKGMEAVLTEAYAEFKKHPSFAGFAIHHYRSYKDLCARK
ncbi:MAG: PDZ domain-containing protein [Candidatus Omnitrophica bacterium]|nr:PDZ domain-containing protein [Candidatus Omnitrophota bacterium]